MGGFYTRTKPYRVTCRSCAPRHRTRETYCTEDPTDLSTTNCIYTSHRRLHDPANIILTCVIKMQSASAFLFSGWPCLPCYILFHDAVPPSTPYNLSFSALVFLFFYLGLSRLAWKRKWLDTEHTGRIMCPGRGY